MATLSCGSFSEMTRTLCWEARLHGASCAVICDDRSLPEIENYMIPQFRRACWPMRSKDVRRLDVARVYDPVAFLQSPVEVRDFSLDFCVAALGEQESMAVRRATRCLLEACLHLLREWLSDEASLEILMSILDLEEVYSLDDERRSALSFVFNEIESGYTQKVEDGHLERVPSFLKRKSDGKMPFRCDGMAPRDDNALYCYKAFLSFPFVVRQEALATTRMALRRFAETELPVHTAIVSFKEAAIELLRSKRSIVVLQYRHDEMGRFIAKRLAKDIETMLSDLRNGGGFRSSGRAILACIVSMQDGGCSLSVINY